ncbi:DUF3823 domain-containing protein [uncultured Parabacteroides sp.]|uniref:DUF3823 domain-containing protein n=1 Tax=uncultured Parabacteroides sp. TaxID=512312 RepID=UPI0025FB1993|nr:DUF3823 domain-containing protein [uncultured Parabacteroides sp.]
MKKISLLLMSICSLCFTSCLSNLDNYDSPNGGIKGQILDAETNEPIPLPVQGSTGVIINMFEQNTDATQSVDFYAKMDGTYENSKLFNCDYKIVVNGPFVSPCEEFITLKGQTTLDLKAMPYARITASAQASGKKITITYKVTPTNSSFNVSEVYGYWNFAPGVDNGSANQAGKQTVKGNEGTIVFDLENDKNYQDNLYKIQGNGNKIYVRVGAKTENAINYSTIIETTIQ